MAAATASAPRFKQFPFFDQSAVHDVHDGCVSPHILQNANEISCIGSSSLGSLVADIHGSLHLLDRDFEPALSWVAHVGGRVTHLAASSSTLVTLGEEDAVSTPLLKIWALDRLDKHGFPVLLRSTKVAHAAGGGGGRRHPVSCITVAPALAALAVGLSDGAVLLYRHLDQALAGPSSSTTSLPKPRVVHESPEPVTGLGFRAPSSPTASSNANSAAPLQLFIATTARVLVAPVNGRGAPVEVHEVGAALGCAAMDVRAQELFVARDEALYVCGAEGRGASFALEGPKLFVQTYRHYLVVVAPPVAPRAGAASFTIRNAAVVARGTTEEVGKVTVFDPANKLVAFSDVFTGGVRAVFAQWEGLYVLTNDGALFRLQEKPTPDKLGMLYARQQHTLALSVARTQGLEPAAVADIHRQYGDYLYGRGDYDAAMTQYLSTIGDVQPSYVIRKFLDAQRIHNLVTYLQELHARGLANADHTTLLLNTYTKLKDTARLDSFIRTEAHTESDTDALPFDLDTAIRVCRQAGYFEHAGYLAKRWQRHEDYLRIQIEDAGNYRDALAYLRHLGPLAAEHNLARYGRKMLEALPDETTRLLIDICTNPALLAAEPEPEEELSPTGTAPRGPSYFSYLNLTRAEPETPARRGSVHEGIRKGSIRDGSGSRRGSVHEASAREGSPPPPAPPPPPPMKRPSPRLYFANFVGHRAAFVTFLETVARRRWGQTIDPAAVSADDGDGALEDAMNVGAATATATAPKPLPPDYVEAPPPADAEADARDQAAVWNTLLELYLSERLTAKAWAVLASALPYDAAHALVLCTTRGYTRGLVLLWTRLGMHEDVLRFWMGRARAGDAGAGARAMRVLEAHGEGDKARFLYPLVLRFLTESAEIMGRHRADLERVLAQITERGIMPPLAVVQVLSRNGVVGVGAVKEWLLARMHEAREEISTDEQLIDSYRRETDAKLKRVAELSDADHPRSFHVTQCASCGGQLDLPSIHFMCNHSYHARCLANNETECPLCAREHAVIRDIRRTNERLADQHDVFLAEVQDSGFRAVAAGFGRGVFNVPKVDAVR